MKKKQLLLISIAIFLLVLFDQMIKLIVSNKIPYLDSITIIPSFFSLTFVKNTGAAFSMLEGKINFFVLLSGAAIIGIIYYLYKKFNKKGITITLGLILAGIIGNLIDRIRLGYVIDYLDFEFGTYHFAIFNFADICIVIGCFLLIILLWREDQHESKNKRTIDHKN